MCLLTNTHPAERENIWDQICMSKMATTAISEKGEGERRNIIYSQFLAVGGNQYLQRFGEGRRISICSICRGLEKEGE